jgi:hypothetical protein
MTIPTDFEDNAVSIGSTNIKHPIITFRVIMARRAEETIGPVTNARTGNMLHPDMHTSSPDSGRINAAQHENQFQPYIPGLLRGSNIVRNDDGTFTAYGEQALYLKTQYADVANPLLVITNSPPYITA